MMNQTYRFAICVALLLGVACQTQADLRGQWAPSDDGKSYLVIQADPGTACRPLWVDGQEWHMPIGQAGVVSAGEHTLACGPAGSEGLEIMVPAQSIYTFNYWGP